MLYHTRMIETCRLVCVEENSCLQGLQSIFIAGYICTLCPCILGVARADRSDCNTRR